MTMSSGRRAGAGRAQGGDGNLLDTGAECFAVDRPGDHPGGHDAVLAQGGDEGHGVPMSEGRAPGRPPAPRRPPAQWRHVSPGPGLVDEPQPFQVDAARTRLPAGALAGDAGPLLLTGERGFFEADTNGRFG